MTHCSSICHVRMSRIIPWRYCLFVWWEQNKYISQGAGSVAYSLPFSTWARKFLLEFEVYVMHFTPPWHRTTTITLVLHLCLILDLIFFIGFLWDKFQHIQKLVFDFNQFLVSLSEILLYIMWVQWIDFCPHTPKDDTVMT